MKFFDWLTIDFSLQSFSFFTSGHYIMIFGMVVIITVLLAISYKKKQWIDKVLWICSAIGATIMLSLMIYALATRVYFWEWFVPLHICNLFVVVMPLSAKFKGKVRTFFLDFMVFGGIGGCLLNVLFPITTLYYLPAWHFVSVFTWIYHVLIGFLGGYLVLSGNYKRYNGFNLLIVLSFLILGGYIANTYLGTNFLFINPDWKVFPLTIFYEIFGSIGVYGVIMIIYALAIILQFIVFAYRKKQKSLLAAKPTA